MNQIQKKRLLNVAKALREAPEPSKFTMVRYFNYCGTPACALGHYVFRTDLQKTFAKNDFIRGGLSSYTDDSVLTHFGISNRESEDLFGDDGCDMADTAIEAAKYIENFVENRS